MDPIFNFPGWNHSALKPIEKDKEPNKEKSQPIQVIFPFSKSDSQYIHEKIFNETPNVQIKSTIYLDRKPSLQCDRTAFCSFDGLFAKTSIGTWTDDMRNQVIEKLIKKGLPLKKVSIEQIYLLLISNQKMIFNDPDLKYPAFFEGGALYQKSLQASATENNGVQPLQELTKQYIPFELEIHSDRKITLLFNKLAESFINQGGFKKLYKAYSLTKPKMFTYSISRSDVDGDKAMEREEKFLPICSAKHSNIIKIYDIFYYTIKMNNEYIPTQIINMRFYSSDIFRLITEDSNEKIKDQLKIQYCCQIAEGIQFLHNQNIIHRDLKVENLLIHSKKGISITDFGLAAFVHQVDECKKPLGSFTFVSPEGYDPNFQKGKPHDIWSLGCVFWLFLKETTYPWYDEASKEKGNTSELLEIMEDYDYNGLEVNSLLSRLLWNMLRFKPKNRWNINQVLSFLNRLNANFVNNPNYKLS